MTARTVLAALLAAVLVPLTFPGAGRADAPPPAAPKTGLSLDEAVRAASNLNEQARISRQNEIAARAQVDRARSAFFPTLTASGTYTRRAHEVTRTLNSQSVVLQSHNALQASATASMPIFDARAFPLYRGARLERDATDAASENDRRLLGFQAASAFFAVLGYEQVAAAAERRVDLAGQSLRDAKARFAAQLVSSNDVTRAELELAQAQQSLVAATADVHNAYLQLGYLIARPVAPPLREPQGLLAEAEAPVPGPTDLVPRAQSNRLDLASALSHAQALHALAKEPLYRWFPTLDLVGQFRGTNEAGFSGNTTDWFVALTLTWTLWDGGAREADRRQRLAEATIADLQSSLQSRQVDLQVRQALVSLSEAQGQIGHAQAAVDAARKNADESNALYRQGLAPELQVADANEKLFEAEVALARQRYGLILAFLDLRSALGQDALGHKVSP